MKKVFFVFSIVLVFLIVGIEADAKTQTKPSPARTTFTLKSLINQLRYQKNDVLEISQNQITRAMKGLGFVYSGTAQTSLEDDRYESEEPTWKSVNVLKFTKRNITVSFYSWASDKTLSQITLSFENATDAKAFIQASKKAMGRSLQG